MAEVVEPHGRRTAPIGLARWAVLAGLSWLVLRPALLITISLDDFINPFYVYDKYGSNPWRVAWRASRDVFRNGHFNVIGQIFGAWVFAAWNYLISWGVRYSLIYATTKYLVLVGCALAAARLLRTLSALIGRPVGVWRARVVVAAVLLTTLQIHVPWGLDPVASFPLYGYLPAALGVLAVDVAIGALQRDDRRSAVLAAAALCGSILYYEINAAAVAALAPVVVLLWLRARRGGASGRLVLLRGGLIMAVPAAMTLVLTVVAKRTNAGYTGTDLEAGSVTVGLLARTVGGSLPASAWGAAHDWLGGPFGLTAATAMSASVVVGALVWAIWQPAWGRRPAGSFGDSVGAAVVGERGQRLSLPWTDVALAAACPAMLWLAATLIQTVTAKVNVETVALGYVYTYYAYGSVGVAVAAIVVCRGLPRRDLWRTARPLLAAVAVVFVVFQMIVNDTVTRAFDVRVAVNDRLLVAVSERPAAEQRCAVLREWVDGTPFLPEYYHRFMVDGLNETYQGHFDELFCNDPSLLASG